MSGLRYKALGLGVWYSLGSRVLGSVLGFKRPVLQESMPLDVGSTYSKWLRLYKEPHAKMSLTSLSE